MFLITSVKLLFSIRLISNSAKADNITVVSNNAGHLNNAVELFKNLGKRITNNHLERNHVICQPIFY